MPHESMPSNPTTPLAPELETSAEQTGLDDAQLVEGEAVVDLNLPDDVAYDVDDLGDGRLAIQYWEPDD